MHRIQQLISIFSILLGSHLTVSLAGGQTPLQTVDMPQGGRIVYGAVDGADSQGSAMTQVLRLMHKKCGEKPQIGRVFKMKGTDSVAVFFTVVNHPAGNVPVAGLIIAAGSVPHKAEAALLSDSSSRFGSTLNPMLSKLAEVWHPGGLATGNAKGSGGGTVRQGGTHSAAAAPLHRFVAPDGSAQVGVPDGWKAQGSGGTMMVMKVAGNDLSVVQLNLTRAVVDPNNPNQRRLQMNGMRGNPGQIVYPANVDLTRAFPDLFKLFWRANNADASDLQVDSIAPVQSGQAGRCVHATGHVKITAPVPGELNALLCTTMPAAMGNYLMMLSFSLLPPSLADQERATTGAILASFQPNQAVIAQQANAMAAPAINAIHEIGRQATIRNEANQERNETQHAQCWSDQESHARYGAGFSNYLLDQTVIRDVEDPNTHALVWNRTAEAWKKAYPDRIEEVPTSQYIPGEDF